MDIAESLRLTEALLPSMKTKTLMELASIELENRPRGGDFNRFCAAKWTLNDKGYQCAACSINHHAENGEPYRLRPCTDCKGKKPIPANDIPVIVPKD